jgi:hypothetical protein
MHAMKIQALSVCARIISRSKVKEREREREAAFRQHAAKAACTRAFNFNSVHLVTRIARICAGRKFWLLKYTKDEAWMK